MQLSPDESRQLNHSLAVLKQVTAARVNRIEPANEIGTDAGYVNRLIEDYVTEDGFASLLLDRQLTEANSSLADCVCGVTCASPCANSMTGVGT